MVDLVLCPSGRDEKSYSLQLRWHESLGETEYQHLAFVDEETAREIISAGKPIWLLDEPKNTGGENG